MRRQLVLAALILILSTPAQAIVLEVRRNANIVAEPISGSTTLTQIAGTASEPVDVVLVGLERENGFYRVFVPDSTDTGWIHKSRGRLRADEDRDTVSVYDRASYRHWIDADEDCQDTREEVLIRSSDPAVTFTSPNGCNIASGQWLDPYSGQIVTSAGELDVDHMVPLENAHLSGAWNWTAERREAYANFLDDPGHLLAVSAAENRSKGEKAPDEFLPSNTDFHCEYVEDWIRVKRDWGLRMTVNEAEATFRIHFDCGGD